MHLSNNNHRSLQRQNSGALLVKSSAKNSSRLLGCENPFHLDVSYWSAHQGELLEMSGSLDTDRIKQWRSIVTLIVFLLTSKFAIIIPSTFLIGTLMSVQIL